MNKKTPITIEEAWGKIRSAYRDCDHELLVDIITEMLDENLRRYAEKSGRTYESLLSGELYDITEEDLPDYEVVPDNDATKVLYGAKK